MQAINKYFLCQSRSLKVENSEKMTNINNLVKLYLKMMLLTLKKLLIFF